MKIHVAASILLVSVAAARTGQRDKGQDDSGLQGNAKRLIKDDAPDKCKAKFVDPNKIKSIQLGDGRLKLRDPWGLHACCRKDNCGSPLKLYSFDKQDNQCQQVILRNICPGHVLLRKNVEHLNLFSTRDSCVQSCKGRKTISFLRNKYKTVNEFEDQGQIRTEADSSISERLPPGVVFGFNRGGPSSLQNYIQRFKEFYEPDGLYSSTQNEFTILNDISTVEEDPCSLDKNEGRANFLKRATMWFFDRYHNQCFVFTYKGSRGNSNRFLTYEECMRRCTAEEIESSQDLPVIPDSARALKIDAVENDLNSVAAFCKDDPPKTRCGFSNIVPKYYFHSSGRCQMYFSNGCAECPQGQCNSFDTKDACKKTCVHKNN